jgi:nitrite reductase/ring-hydroxylating ferredoxin subunit
MHPAPDVPDAPEDLSHPLCSSRELINGGQAVPFDVCYAGQTCRAFAVRYQGQPHAYLNRCSHVAMEMDWQPNRLFDDTGRWLLCSTHGATYEPATGACAGGPCRGGLVKIELHEQDGVVHWRSQYRLKPVDF